MLKTKSAPAPGTATHKLENLLRLLYKHLVQYDPNNTIKNLEVATTVALQWNKCRWHRSGISIFLNSKDGDQALQLKKIIIEISNIDHILPPNYERKDISEALLNVYKLYSAWIWHNRKPFVPICHYPITTAFSKNINGMQEELQPHPAGTDASARKPILEDRVLPAAENIIQEIEFLLEEMLIPSDPPDQPRLLQRIKTHIHQHYARMQDALERQFFTNRAAYYFLLCFASLHELLVFTIHCMTRANSKFFLGKPLSPSNHSNDMHAPL
jgi:hypothetical protein